MDAYIGLDVATYIKKCYDFSNYCNRRMFMGNVDFKRVVSHRRFHPVRSNLAFYPFYDHYIDVCDSLRNSRKLIENFLKNVSKVAAPVGALSFDENNSRYSDMTTERSYVKSEPVRFGIRFYAVLGWYFPHLFSFWGNNSGNKAGVAQTVN